jgi:hypothetical protein
MEKKEIEKKIKALVAQQLDLPKVNLEECQMINL